MNIASRPAAMASNSKRIIGPDEESLDGSLAMLDNLDFHVNGANYTYRLSVTRT